MERPEMYRIVCQTLSGLMEEYAIERTEFSEDTTIYGTQDGISSLMLVRLIVDLEEAIEREYGLLITIADDKILSARSSPFADLKSLTDFLMMLVTDQNSA
jgi:acyl carrier protein